MTLCKPGAKLALASGNDAGSGEPQCRRLRKPRSLDMLSPTTRIAFWPGLALTFAACGSSEVPAKQLAESESAIRAASEVGAEDNPQASLHLKLAKDRYAQAEAAAKDGEQETAKQLLEKAEADAELALALTRQEQASAKAQQAKEKMQPKM
jgi:hypothetical protein